MLRVISFSCVPGAAGRRSPAHKPAGAASRTGGEGQISTRNSWCRRGDSNPHELPHTPLKRARLPVPPLRLVRDGFQKLNACTVHFFAGDFDGCASMVDVGTATGAFGAGVACVLAAADGDGNGACSGTPDCNTELVPVIIGNESINANSMKAAAAPIVIFDNNVCVPLGP